MNTATKKVNAINETVQRIEKIATEHSKEELISMVTAKMLEHERGNYYTQYIGKDEEFETACEDIDNVKYWKPHFKAVRFTLFGGDYAVNEAVAVNVLCNDSVFENDSNIVCFVVDDDDNLILCKECEGDVNAKDCELMSVAYVYDYLFNVKDGYYNNENQ